MLIGAFTCVGMKKHIKLMLLHEIAYAHSAANGQAYTTLVTYWYCLS